MRFIITITLCIFISAPAFAQTATLPIRAVIINLTQMPLEQAIAFCNERGLECPNIRAALDE
jgi:hypothetical protein